MDMDISQVLRFPMRLETVHQKGMLKKATTDPVNATVPWYSWSSNPYFT